MLATRREPGYGALSIFTALRATSTPGRVVPPGQLSPAAESQSASGAPASVDGAAMERGTSACSTDVVRVAFGGRRKMLRNTLGRGFPIAWAPSARSHCSASAPSSPPRAPKRSRAADFARLARRSYELLERRAGASGGRDHLAHIGAAPHRPAIRRSTCAAAPCAIHRPDFAAALTRPHRRRGRAARSTCYSTSTTGARWMVHLGMSGRFLHRRSPTAHGRTAPTTSRRLDGGSGVFFHDPRRFGLMIVDEPRRRRCSA